MKKILFFLLILLGGTTFATADVKTDSALNAITNRLAKVEKENVAKLNALTTANKEEVAKCKDGCKALETWQHCLVLLPCVLFIVLVFLTLRKMQSAGFSFKQAFYNDEPEDKIIQAPTTDNPNATVKITLLNKNGEPIYYPSISRIIAFLSGLTTLIVVVSFMSYYAYCMFAGFTEMPKFEGLSNLIMGLGLGVLPYSVNRVATSITPKPPANP
ncbi:MAG TPA: hypothetical protein VN698_16560 [Bacteroidia bacterium]|nr:hypothetical protein [Bacteroidia bacterium]